MKLTTPIRPLILSGPSGSGRTVLAFKLITEFPKKFARAVSYTSRPKRQNEIDGVHYYFKGRQAMKEMDYKGQFLMYFKDALTNQYYGTAQSQIFRIVSSNEIPLLEMNPVRFADFRQKIACNGIYIKPDSFQKLRQRLTKQTLLEKQEIDKKVSQGISQYEWIIKQQIFGPTDIIVNSSLQQTYTHLKARLFQLY